MRRHFLPLCFLLLLLLLQTSSTKASHIMGGRMSYQYLGNDDYEMTLVVMLDREGGFALELIESADISIYTGDKSLYLRDTVDLFHEDELPVRKEICVDDFDDGAIIRTFRKTIHLPLNSDGYYLVWEQCCRDEKSTNIADAGRNGAVYYCYIAPELQRNNSAAVFKSLDFLIVCPTGTLYLDNSAIDPDGDSLSYELWPPYKIQTLQIPPNNIKEIQTPPPYDAASFVTGFSYLNPLGEDKSCSLDAETGMLEFAPVAKGSALVSIACHEWRAGVKINTVYKEFPIKVHTNDYFFTTRDNPGFGWFGTEIYHPDGQPVIHIYEMSGRLARTCYPRSGFSGADMSGLANGLYIVKYQDRSHQGLWKFFKTGY